MESGEQNQEAIANTTDGNQPPPSLSVAAAKKQNAAEEKARRYAHLLRVIENAAWQEAENFMVEDNVLKQIAGFDPALTCMFGLSYMTQTFWRL